MVLVLAGNSTSTHKITTKEYVGVMGYDTLSFNRMECSKMLSDCPSAAVLEANKSAIQQHTSRASAFLTHHLLVHLHTLLQICDGTAGQVCIG
jgi:hypothetical protein